MEEDVEAGSASDHGNIIDDMKKEDIETEDVHTTESSNFSQPPHYQNFSRILSVVFILWCLSLLLSIRNNTSYTDVA